MGERKEGPKDLFRGWTGPKSPKRWRGMTGNQRHIIRRKKRQRHWLLENGMKVGAQRLTDELRDLGGAGDGGRDAAG